MEGSVRIRSPLAIALVLLAPALASAFPIQNYTDTDVDSTQGVNLVLSGSALLNGSTNTSRSGQTFYVGSFWTKTLDVDNGDPSSAPGNQGYTGNQIFTGTEAVDRPSGAAPSGGYYTYRTYCMELTETVQTNDNKLLSSTIETVPPVGGFDQYGSPYAADSPAAAQRAAWVIANASSVGAAQAANIENAAIQLAVWEIMYDAGIAQTGDVKSGSIFSASGTTKTQLATLARANELLAASFLQSGQGFVIRQNFRYDYAGPAGTYYRLGSGQDLLVGVRVAVAVPEPSSLAIAGLGAAGLVGYGSFRRRRAAR